MIRRTPHVRIRSAAALAACTVALSSVTVSGVGHAKESSKPAPVAATATPALKWEQNLPRMVLESSPKVADIDGDGGSDILVGSHDGQLYIFRGASGGYLPGWPQPTGNKIDSSAAIADLDGNGHNEIYIGSGNHEAHAGALNAFSHTGHRRWQYHAADIVFPRPAIHSTPTIGDITGDRVPEISFGSLGLESIHSVDRNGVRLRGFPFYADDTIFSSPSLLDVTGDGVKEIIIGGDQMAGTGAVINHQGGQLRAVRGDGSLVWEFRVNDIIRGGPAIGDIDGDGSPDIVFGGGDFYGGSDSVKVYALDLHGRLKPGWPQATNGVTNAGPTLADVSGNGILDVVIGTFNSIHGRGNGGSVYVWNGKGASLYGYPRVSGGGVVNGSITTADLTGDGRQDLLVPTGAAVFAYDGANGNRLFSLSEGKGTGFLNSPLVTDIDGNSRLDIFVAGRRSDGRGVVQRYEMPTTTAEIGHLGWPQYRLDTRNTGAYLSLASARSTTNGCPPGEVPSSGFPDVSSSSVHSDAIDCIAWWEISKGKDGDYLPSAAVHRDQMASFVARLVEGSGGTLPAYPADAFADDEGNPHESAINKLAAVGIVAGVADGRYDPAARVTRGQMATFLMRAYTHRTGNTPSTSINYFADAAGNTHQTNINHAAAVGFTGGSTSGKYLPLAPVWRDQMASFLARLLDLVVVDTGAPTP